MAPHTCACCAIHHHSCNLTHCCRPPLLSNNDTSHLTPPPHTPSHPLPPSSALPRATLLPHHHPHPTTPTGVWVERGQVPGRGGQSRQQHDNCNDTIVMLSSSPARCCCGHKKVQERVAKDGTRWASGHNDGMTIATTRSSCCRHHRIVVTGAARAGECGRGPGLGRGQGPG